MRAGGVGIDYAVKPLFSFVPLGRVKAAASSRPGRISDANALQLQMCQNFFRLISQNLEGCAQPS